MKCQNCDNCIPIGEGDHICNMDPTRLVLSDYLPTTDYAWCEEEEME